MTGVTLSFTTQNGDFKTWNGKSGGKVFPTNPKGPIAGLTSTSFARTQASGPLAKLGLGGKQPLQAYGNCSCTEAERNNCPSGACGCNCTQETGCTDRVTYCV